MPATAYKAYFFKDKRTGAVRRTPIYAKSAAAAKDKLTRPPAEYAVIEKVRAVTAKEHKAAQGGKWVSSKVAKDFEHRRGFGPKPKQDNLVNLSDTLLHIDAKGKYEFTYDSKVRRYRYKDTGQFVSKAAFAHLTQKHILAIKQDLLGHTTDLLSDKLSFRDWQKQSAITIRRLHVQQYLLGRGGAQYMQQSDMKIINDELKFQVEKLRGFAQAIKSGKLSEAQIKARAGLYAASGKKSHAEAKNQAAIAVKLTEYKNILYPGESCDECIEITNKGWTKIGSQKKIGNRTCLVNCNCGWEYR